MFSVSAPRLAGGAIFFIKAAVEIAEYAGALQPVIESRRFYKLQKIAYYCFV
jgi:hypothetical protein